jgi:hypothetical protein
MKIVVRPINTRSRASIQRFRAHINLMSLDVALVGLSCVRERMVGGTAIRFQGIPDLLFQVEPHRLELPASERRDFRDAGCMPLQIQTRSPGSFALYLSMPELSPRTVVHAYATLAGRVPALFVRCLMLFAQQGGVDLQFSKLENDGRR